MNKYLTPFLITILLVVVLIVIFALIYHHLESDNENPYARGWMNAFYTATTIQTNIGMATPPEPEKTSVRAWYIVQSILSYLITLGLIFVLFKAFFLTSNGSNGSKKIMSPV